MVKLQRLLVSLAAVACILAVATMFTPLSAQNPFSVFFGAIPASTGNGTSSTGTLRVAVASNNTAFGVNLAEYTASSGRLPVLADINNGSATATVGGTSNVALVSFVGVDPCLANAKITDPFSITARAVIIAATSAKKNYICGLLVVAGAAEIFNIDEGTGTTCQTGTAAILGSTTAANGASFAANGGGMIGTGAAAILNGKTANVDTCIVPSSTNRLSGFVTYVQQ